jgi:cell division protein FtsN
MSPDPKAEQERDDFEYDPPRSIFAATWFRALLVLIVVGVAGAVAIPYALDWMNPPPLPDTAAAVQSAPLPVAPPSASSAPSSEAKEPAGSPVAAVTPAPAADAAPGRPATPGEAATTTPAPTPAPAKTEPTEPAKTDARSAPVAAKTDAKPGSDAKPASDTAVKKSARATRTAARPAAASGGAWWVQVGAFKDAQTAQRVADKLRAANFQVQETTVTRAAAPARSRGATPAAGGGTAEQYDVFVSGMPTPELTGRLTTKGLASEASGSGVVVRPSLPLRDAVALSKDLAAEGLKVQVRRAGGDAGVSPSAAPAAPGGPEATLHRVRVGSFGDRAAATAAMRELESKGFKGFLARGES